MGDIKCLEDESAAIDEEDARELGIFLLQLASVFFLLISFPDIFLSQCWDLA